MKEGLLKLIEYIDILLDNTKDLKNILINLELNENNNVSGK